MRLLHIALERGSTSPPDNEAEEHEAVIVGVYVGPLSFSLWLGRKVRVWPRW